MVNDDFEYNAWLDFVLRDLCLSNLVPRVFLVAASKEPRGNPEGFVWLISHYRVSQKNDTIEIIPLL